ncbi:SLBB domain-containing protein [Alkalitalea saponilacus]|uniref:Protein involved in polysaccharide export, contains SLBB domain of the beta-grasp fold n=1 Tax=Alkalitalea saponilacus TaxID=889453 RepID=A0A1T5FIV4_9BACT|nr:SLBB domain-containing protein [Alkalitalea saponilacus]ASB49409.1 capsule biosynthesis protein [Alkalitalea saponilacus]SKB96144.1 protein involved in polysaccharide export, contains SLBB domain of the beta-grasp fold [Alkalitalea saponilacus]
MWRIFFRTSKSSLTIFSFVLFTMLSGLISETVAAQSGLNMHDLSGVRSQDVSDAQLRSFIARGEAQGISPEQAMMMARERGMPASVVQELMARVRTMQGAAQEQPALRARERVGTEESGLFDQDLWSMVHRDVSDKPEIFGARIFKRGMLSFEPSMHVPTPMNYRLGPGDELVIDIWGAATNFYQLEVSSEGTISIDNLGPLYVHGLTIQEAEQRVMDKLKQIYRGLRPGDSGQNTFARISLGRVRSIQVALMGEVNSPGNYTVSSLATVFNALYKAGGPNMIGSFRNVEVIRENRQVAVLDVYDFLISGDQSQNIRLQDQDIIRVGTYANRIEMRGEVKRPGLYEVKIGETLAQLINYAGSFTDSAYVRQIRIHRNTETEREILSVNRERFEHFTMRNGDVVIVDQILDRFSNRVSISGAVWRPGEYEIGEEGLMLSELLQKAEGVKPDAFRSRAIINRLTDNFDFTILAFNVDNILNNPEAFDISLQNEDEVIIKDIHEMREGRNVVIRGAVQTPNTYDFREGMTLEDLILVANGFTSAASEARIEVNRRVIGDAAPLQRGHQLAETFIFAVDRDLSIRSEAASFELKPFDQIFVRARPDYREQVTINVEGEVLYPGEYVLTSRNERISDLVQRAGGLTHEAFMPGATLLRQTIELERVEVDIEGGSDDVIELENVTERYIGIDLGRILENPGSEDDLFLRTGDVIRIPSELQTVSVRGGVLRESEIRFRDGRNLNYYINRSGGFAENARKRHAYVVYANGDVAARRNFLFFRSNPDVTAGAEIIIPQKEERPRLTPGERISIMSSVVSMTAVVITAMSRVW